MWVSVCQREVINKTMLHSCLALSLRDEIHKTRPEQTNLCDSHLHFKDEDEIIWGVGGSFHKVTIKVMEELEIPLKCLLPSHPLAPCTVRPVERDNRTQRPWI